MIKRTLAILSVSAAFFAHAQDVSTIKNVTEVYGTPLSGTSKYNAMAGATGALGGDVSSFHNNPAGIGVAITSDVSGTLYIQNNKNKTELFGNTNNYTINHGDLGQIGGLAAFEIRKNSPWKFVNLAVNFSSKSVEDYVESSGPNDITFDVANDQLAFNRHAYDRTGTVGKMSIGVGGNYDNKIYVGAGLNLHNASISQSDAAQMTFASDNYSDVYYKQYTPFSEDATGFSATVGVIGKVGNQFRLGAAIETPTWWNIDHTYRYYDPNVASNDGDYAENQKLQTPMKATVSAGFVPSKNFALNVDYSIALTKPKYSVGDNGLQAEYDDFFENYKNQSEVKVGAEYRVNQFRIRGGYAFTTNPYDSFTVATLASNNTEGNQTFNDMFAGKRNTVGVGLGYDFKSFYVDAAYQNLNTTYSNPFLRGSESAGTGYFSDDYYVSREAFAVSKVKNNQNNFSVTVGWKF